MARPKKIHYFKLKPYKNAAGTESWRVTGTKPDGTRVRQNFLLKAEAIQTLADLEADLVGHTTVSKMQRTRLSAEELGSAEAAILSSPGRDISAIVTHYLALERRAKNKGVDLDAALSFVEFHHRSEIQTATVLSASREFLDSRLSGSPKTKEHYESSLNLLLKPDPNRYVHSFTVTDIEKILGRYKNVNSKRTYRRAFKTFFNWCIRHHYCLEDPCKRLDKLPKDMTQIAMLSLTECKRLLYAAMTYHDGVAAAPVAIALFAGLRPSELADLKAEDIGDTVIRVSGGKMRRKLKRSAPLPPVLSTWLERYPFKGLPVGWDYKMRQLKKATKATKWVPDILRHTSISFQTERDKNEAFTAFHCGTSIQMMNLHYRHTVDDEQVVKAFWDLTPAKILAKKPAVELPTVRRITWPTKAELRKLVWQKPLVHAAKDLGVSDVALKKHCVKSGIDLPPAGHWIRQQRNSTR